MRMHTASGRSRWPYVIGAIIVLLGLIGGIAYVTTRPGGEPDAATPSSAPVATPSPSPSGSGGSSGAGDGQEGEAPTGCLGGPDRDAAMVVAAQQEAPHTGFGAVEVATAFYRFLWQYPYPSQADIDEVGATIFSEGTPESFADISGGYASAGDNPTQDYVPAGTEFQLSTTNGLWVVSEGSAGDRVEVSLGAGYVIDGALSPTRSAVNGFVMVWENDAWHVDVGLTVDQDRLAAGGTRFTRGC